MQRDTDGVQAQVWNCVFASTVYCVIDSREWILQIKKYMREYYR